MTRQVEMKIWVAILCIIFVAGQTSADEIKTFKTKEEKISYGIGVSVARNFKQQGVEVSTDFVVKGLQDALSGGKLLMDEEDLRATLNAYQAELKQKQAQVRMMAAEKNKNEGDAFLAGNKQKEGVVTLASGLQYKILKAGDGKMPTDADTVECNYRGTLISGTEFDSSYKVGKPGIFKVTGVIPGWVEALKLMPVGSKWQLFIPSQLAYGERGAGMDIGPNQTLIFEVELLAIK